MISSKTLLLCVLLITTLTCTQTRSDDAKDQVIGSFSNGDMSGWQPKIFDNETQYTIATITGEQALKAESRNAASGLFREVTVDIKQTPYLNWRWRVEERLSLMDEKNKSGDDYAARIYLVIDGGWFFWKTKALNYVWSSRHVKEDIWPNAYTPDNTRMIAIRTASDSDGFWYEEKRNVYQDFRQWLGEAVESIDAIAIMTDTDNSDSAATAYYGDIFFSSH